MCYFGQYGRSKHRREPIESSSAQKIVSYTYVFYSRRLSISALFLFLFYPTYIKNIEFIRYLNSKITLKHQIWVIFCKQVTNRKSSILSFKWRKNEEKYWRFRNGGRGQKNAKIKLKTLFSTAFILFYVFAKHAKYSIWLIQNYNAFVVHVILHAINSMFPN